MLIGILLEIYIYSQSAQAYPLLAYEGMLWEGHIAGIGDFGGVFLCQEWSSSPGYCKKYILRSSPFHRAIKKVSRPSGSTSNSSLKLFYLDFIFIPLIRQTSFVFVLTNEKIVIVLIQFSHWSEQIQNWFVLSGGYG